MAYSQETSLFRSRTGPHFYEENPSEIVGERTSSIGSILAERSRKILWHIVLQ